MEQKEFEETEKIYLWAKKWRKRHPSTKRVPLWELPYWKYLYNRHRRIAT